MLPERLLRKGETAAPVRTEEGLTCYEIWRGRRPPVRLALCWVGTNIATVPAGASEAIARLWPRPGTTLPEHQAEGLLAPLAQAAGLLPSQLVEQLLRAGELIRYHALAPGGLVSAGQTHLLAGEVAVARQSARLSRQEAAHQAWLAAWIAEVAAVPSLSGPGARLKDFLRAAVSAAAAGERIALPGEEQGTARQPTIQIALAFLVAAAGRMATGEPFDWKATNCGFRQKRVAPAVPLHATQRRRDTLYLLRPPSDSVWAG